MGHTALPLMWLSEIAIRNPMMPKRFAAFVINDDVSTWNTFFFRSSSAQVSISYNWSSCTAIYKKWAEDLSSPQPCSRSHGHHSMLDWFFESVPDSLVWSQPNHDWLFALNSFQWSLVTPSRPGSTESRLCWVSSWFLPLDRSRCWGPLQLLPRSLAPISLTVVELISIGFIAGIKAWLTSTVRSYRSPRPPRWPHPPAEPRSHLSRPPSRPAVTRPGPAGRRAGTPIKLKASREPFKIRLQWLGGEVIASESLLIGAVGNRRLLNLTRDTWLRNKFRVKFRVKSRSAAAAPAGSGVPQRYPAEQCRPRCPSSE